ncbi:TRAM domain-containing protein [Candidatus Woesearchaeota archaeon]|nr:TRAM domain-containing protein [Candidatus Woesearchaeota archaeon]
MYGGSRERFGGPRRDSGFRDSGFAPVKVGDELEVTIEAVGEKGDGIAKVKGFVLFIPGTKAGETVKVRVNKVLRKVGFAEVIGASDKKASEEETQEEDSEEETSEESEEETQEEPQEETSEESYEDSEEF